MGGCLVYCTPGFWVLCGVVLWIGWFDCVAVLVCWGCVVCVLGVLWSV